MVNLWRSDLFLFLLFVSHSSLGKEPCDSSSVVEKQCHETLVCVAAADSDDGYCECLPGHTKVNDTFCAKINDSTTSRSSSLVEKEDDGGGGGHVVAGIFIPVFLIMVVMAGVYFNRKYHLVDYFISKLNQRSINYDEVMIGQDPEDDDPPLR